MLSKSYRSEAKIESSCCEGIRLTSVANKNPRRIQSQKSKNFGNETDASDQENKFTHKQGIRGQDLQVEECFLSRKSSSSKVSQNSFQIRSGSISPRPENFFPRTLAVDVTEQFNKYYIFFACLNQTFDRSFKHWKSPVDEEFYPKLAIYFLRKSLELRKLTDSPEEIRLLQKHGLDDGYSDDPLPPADSAQQLKAWAQKNKRWIDKRAIKLHSFVNKKKQGPVEVDSYKQYIYYLIENEQIELSLPDSVTEPTPNEETIIERALASHPDNCMFRDCLPDVPLPFMRKRSLKEVEHPNTCRVDPDYDWRGKLKLASNILIKTYQESMKVEQLLQDLESAGFRPNGSRGLFHLKPASSARQQDGLLVVKVEDTSNPTPTPAASNEKVRCFIEDCNKIMNCSSMEMSKLEYLRKKVVDGFYALDSRQDQVDVLDSFQRFSERSIFLCQNELTLANFFVMFVRMGEITNNKHINPVLQSH